LSIIEALILGVVQGITEFLPVSSSGHLVLLQQIFGIEEPVLLFDTMVHMGTLVAVFAVLWQDIWDILRKFFQPLTLFLVIATLPAVIAALLFNKQIERAFASPSFLGFSFLITSALLLFSELLYRRKKPGAPDGSSEGKMTWLDALIIGLLQAIAIIPGISRSGATLSGGLFRGLNRDFVVRFSFLLSIPAILGALVF
jgi:undecaprenyl-diphosphatase